MGCAKGLYMGSGNHGVDGVFVVEVDRVSVINSSVSCISKLTATDECLVEVGYNVNRVCWSSYP